MLSGEAVLIEDGCLCVHCYEEATTGLLVQAELVVVRGPRVCGCCGSPITWEDTEVGEESDDYTGPPVPAGQWHWYTDPLASDYEWSVGACEGEYDDSDEELTGEDHEPVLQPAEWWAEAQSVVDTEPFPARPPVAGPILVRGRVPIETYQRSERNLYGAELRWQSLTAACCRVERMFRSSQ